jgi:hypothetical protein
MAGMPGAVARLVRVMGPLIAPIVKVVLRVLRLPKLAVKKKQRQKVTVCITPKN